MGRDRTTAPGTGSVEYPEAPSGDLMGQALQTAWDMAVDDTVHHHGYTATLRDYEFVIQHFDRWRPVSAYSRFVLKHCVEVDVRSSLTVGNWKVAHRDINLDRVRWQEDTDGYLWANESQDLYPGGMLATDSRRAELWSDALGIPFHELVVETNVQRMVLVFSTMSVTPVALPYQSRVLTD